MMIKTLYYMRNPGAEKCTSAPSQINQSMTSLQIIFLSIHSMPGVPQEHTDRTIKKCYFDIMWKRDFRVGKKTLSTF